MTTRSSLMIFVAFAVALLPGCSSTSTCNRDPDALAVCNGDGKSGPNTWFSSAYVQPGMSLSAADSGYQYFPPARTITFQHNLGSLPHPEISLAFHGNGSLAPTAGNQALIECMDNRVIQIKNDTCSDFYIWIQLSGSGILSDTECPDTTVLNACPGVAGAGPGASGGAPEDAAGAGGASP